MRKWYLLSLRGQWDEIRDEIPNPYGSVKFVNHLLFKRYCRQPRVFTDPGGVASKELFH